MRTRRGQPQFIPIFRARLERISPPATFRAFLRSRYSPFQPSFLSLSLSLSLSLCRCQPFSSLYRTFSEWFIPPLHPFGSAVHCEIVWGETRSPQGTADFQSLLAQLEVSKSRRGNSVSQIAKRGPPWWRAGGWAPRGYFRRKCFESYLPRDQRARARSQQFSSFTQTFDSPHVDRGEISFAYDLARSRE